VTTVRFSAVLERDGALLPVRVLATVDGRSADLLSVRGSDGGGSSSEGEDVLDDLTDCEVTWLAELAVQEARS